MPPDADLLARLERYYDAIPRAGARIEAAGPFTLFVSEVGSPFYARPRLGLTDPINVADAAAVLERQRALGVPEAIEWVMDTTPSLGDAARSAGLAVEALPLLVLDTLRPPPVSAEIRVRRVAADAEDLARVLAIAPLAFGAAGTAIGPAGPAERDAAAAADTTDRTRLRARLASGAVVMVVAEDADGPLASGVHQPIDGVTEIVAVATLPAARRRGLASAVTAALAADARDRGVGTVFLSAADEAVARIYERLGFRRAATAGVAERGGS